MNALQEIQPSSAFKVANVVVGGLLIAGAVGNFLVHSFSSIIIGTYSLLFGVVTLALELAPIPPFYAHLINRYASFFYSFAGRGVFYVLAGVLLFNHYTLLYVSGSLIGFIGVVYFALEFLPLFPPPTSMAPPENSPVGPEGQPIWSAEGEV
ncbi:hypothetical protein BOTBODRAFT_192015 [Botryobasidium botryosum FD-172 SS1]|uniref:Golgi apparatus membrane protein TVP15 n=1 Tax=Botryobasidium botryosum (strain FD-172 SS1) TaxID=930990 RepID=A0A067M049_BOTB1|nr:hypothetical protein BOTBODRAFT_192015 [Botryobasidium botryosum FD-172 SS1]